MPHNTSEYDFITTGIPQLGIFPPLSSKIVQFDPLNGAKLAEIVRRSFWVQNYTKKGIP